ncbi:regulatory protein RecX [Hippea sp. KM1]|uniref:regulatory protein RecX n=1 Tax=Hippea sp. KM1 TaxID=944481 RepID=UPI00046D2968|nr:regulatory protein RecX [Hippea sp. KM1]
MDYKEALKYSLGLLGKRDYSKKEIQERLKKRGVSEVDIERVVEKLEDSGFLDDRRYAENYVFFRLKRGYGKLRIRHELILKGIDESIVDGALSEQTEEAEEVFLKRLRILKDKPNARKRLFDFMYRRGFDKHTIIELLNKYDVREKENEII